MLPRYRVLSLILLLSLCAQQGIAQSRHGLRCPTPRRQKVYTIPPELYFDLAAGVHQPLLYRNGGQMDNQFHFSARPGPFLSATGHMKHSNGLELTLGFEALHNQQGLVLKYNSGDANIRESGYTGAFVLRAPIGLGYYIKPYWSVNASAFIAYTSYWTYTSSGRQSLNAGSGSSTLASFNRWQVPDNYSKWYPGISLSSQLRIKRRISCKVFCSMDFAQATPNASIVEINTNGTPQTFKASLQPYLMNAGLGLSYRLGKEKE